MGRLIRIAAVGRDPERVRRRHHHVSADPGIAGRSGGVFRGAGSDRAGDRRDSPLAGSRPQPAGAVPHLLSSDLAHGGLAIRSSTGQPVLQELLTRLPASIELTLLALILSVAIAVPLGVTRRTPAQFLGRPSLPVRRHRRSMPADLLHRPVTGLRLLLPAGLGAGAARPARYDLLAAAAVHRASTLSTACSRATPRLPGRRCAADRCRRLTLAIFTLAPIARMTRAAMLSVLERDFVRAARANGLSHHAASSMSTPSGTRCCRC